MPAFVQKYQQDGDNVEGSGIGMEAHESNTQYRDGFTVAIYYRPPPLLS